MPNVSPETAAEEADFLQFRLITTDGVLAWQSCQVQRWDVTPATNAGMFIEQYSRQYSSYMVTLWGIGQEDLALNQTTHDWSCTPTTGQPVISQT